jgi:hypothetical protein
MVMRPAAAATNFAVNVAMPLSRCRKFSAVRSAVSSAAASPVTNAIGSLAPAREPSDHNTSSTTAASSWRNVSAATSKPATTSSDLARITPRARWPL